MSRRPALLFALTALLGAPAAQAQNITADLKACRQLADGARRLACYDAVSLPAAAPAIAAPAAVATPPVVAAAPGAKFGQESVRAPAGTPDLRRIESRIRGKFAGWEPNSRIELENGQVWRIADDSSAIYELQNPKATVHRGMLGAFFLEIEGVGFQMRVVRVR